MRDLQIRLQGLLCGPLDDRRRHEIGTIVVEVKNGCQASGANPVLELANALGADLASLYRYASVAERWTFEEVLLLTSGRGPSARRATWTHLVLIASVQCAAERARWVERVRRESLSVRELAQLLGAPDATLVSTNVVRATRTAERFLATAPRITERALDTTPPQAASSLDRAIDAFEALRRSVEAQLEALRRARNASGSATVESRR